MSLFITFEGIEGAGKTTQARRLRDWLENDLGRTVLFTREPGGTPAGDLIRDILLRPDFTLESETELFLLLASRSELCRRVIRPALERGEIVIADRFGDSSVAYQGSGRGLGMETVRGLVEVATGGLRPDLTILLDIEPELGLERCLKVEKSEKRGGDRDRMESESLAFFERVRAGYLEIARSDPGRFRVIQVRDDKDATFREVKAAVEELLRSSGD